MELTADNLDNSSKHGGYQHAIKFGLVGYERNRNVRLFDVKLEG